MATTLVVNALAIVAIAIVGRSLGPAGMGDYQAVVRWTAIGISAFCLSLGQASAYMSAQRGITLRSLTANAIASAAGLSLLLGAIGWALAPSIYGPDAYLVDAGRLFLLLVPVSLLTDYLGQLLRASLDVRTFNAARIAQSVVQCGLIVVLYVGHRANLLEILLAVLGSYVFGLAILVIQAARRGWLGGSPSWRLWRATSSYAVVLHPGAEAREINLYLDQLMMSLLLPPASLGLYAAAVSAATVLRIGSSAFLLLAQAEVQGVPVAQRTQVVLGITRLNLAVMLPSALLVALAMPTLLPLVYGEAFAPAIGPAQILCIGVAIEGYAVAIAGALVGVGRARAAATWQIASLLVSFVGLTIVMPSGRIDSVAWVSVLSYSVAAAGLAAAASREFHVSVAGLLVPPPRQCALLARRILRAGLRAP